MKLINYVVENGYNETEYNLLEKNINSITDAIIKNIKSLHSKKERNFGMFFNVDEIITNYNNTDFKNSEITPFIIQSLKTKNVEFREIDGLKHYRL